LTGLINAAAENPEMKIKFAYQKPAQSPFFVFFQPPLHHHSFLHVGGNITVIVEQMLMSYNTCCVQQTACLRRALDPFQESGERIQPFL